MTRVLIVATSRKTRGGITAVVKAHETGGQWKRFHCHWVQTHCDANFLVKLLYFITGMADFLVRIPFCKIVHIHVSQAVSAKRKCLFLWMSKLCGKKVIVHFHAFDVESTIQGKNQKRYKYLFTNADLVIVLSEWWKKQVISTFQSNDSRIEVLYNPCPVLHIKDIYEKKNYVLYAGTVNSRKGYQDLIRAFAMIASKYPLWKLVIAGNGEVDMGMALAKQLRISSQVEFKGWVSGKEKEQVFSEASIFCLPSYAEGFPMAVLDAWAYGLPVITTPVGGIPDIAKDGKNMLLFNPGDVTMLSKQMDILLSDKNYKEILCSESKKLAEGLFNIDNINNKLAELYNRVLYTK